MSRARSATRAEIRKGNVSQPIANGWTALHSALLGGNYDAVELLLANGAGVNKPANDGWTPLHVAVANAHTAWRQQENHSLDRIHDLIRAGSDLGATDKNGRTPLHWAASQGYSRFTDALHVTDAVVRVLLDANADLNTVDKIGRTPLHYAAEMGYDPIVGALVRAGAKQTIRDKAGKTPVQLAKARQLTTTVAVLRTGKTVDPKPVKQPAAIGDGKLGKELVQAASKGNLPLVKELLKQKADVQYRDSDGFRAIDRARNNGHRAIVTLLQEAEISKSVSQ